MNSRVFANTIYFIAYLFVTFYFKTIGCEMIERTTDLVWMLHRKTSQPSAKGSRRTKVTFACLKHLVKRMRPHSDNRIAEFQYIKIGHL